MHKQVLGDIKFVQWEPQRFVLSCAVNKLFSTSTFDNCWCCSGKCWLSRSSDSSKESLPTQNHRMQGHACGNKVGFLMCERYTLYIDSGSSIYIFCFLYRCQRLEKLTLCQTNMASATLFCPRLLCLDVSSCLKLSDAGIRTAVTSCRSLLALNISQCSYVSDETLREICIACSNLRVLDASWCPNISLQASKFIICISLKLAFAAIFTCYVCFFS
jgi:hypothetical protein